MKNKDVLIDISNTYLHNIKFKKYELSKCDILIERLINYRFTGGFKHTAELKNAKH